MPRPKRSRVASSRAAALPSSSSAAVSDRPPLATKPNAPNVNIPAGPPSDIYDISDREKARKKKKNAVEPVTRTQNYAAVLDTSRHRRDVAMSRLDNLTSTTSNDTSDVHSPPVEAGRRASSVPAHVAQPTRRVTDASGLELDDDLFAALDDSIGTQDDDDTQARTGQSSTDTSSFNIALFKRRPRASSVARDASIRPSSRGGATTPLSSTFSFGLFKRRARAPSILGTAQKERSFRRAPSSQVSQTSGDEAEEDSIPDAAGTPLGASQRLSSQPVETSREPSPAAFARKRKSQEAHGSAKRRSIEGEEIHQSIEVDSSSPLSSVEAGVPTPERPATPDMDDPVMAPPLSSGSSDGSPVVWPSLDALGHRVYPPRRAPSRARNTPGLDADASDVSSPPSLTHSPNYRASPAKTRRKAREPSPKWTTKDLASLLPRRRVRARSNDPFGLGSDDEADSAAHDRGEDELSYMETRRIRKRAPRGKISPSEKSRRRTYGRSADQDEEDDAGDDEPEEGQDEESSENAEERMSSSEELSKAAQKFKEVDRWEMAFEEVTESSSPAPDAR